MPVEFLHHRARRRYDEVGGRQTAGDSGPVGVPVLRRHLPLNGVPPGKHARMTDNQMRLPPRQRPVGVAVQVDQVRVQIVFERKKPIAGTLDVVPRILHPLELETAFKNLNVGKAVNLPPLGGRDRSAHGCQRDLDAVRSQTSNQIETIRPNSADRIGGHQHTLQASLHLRTTHFQLDQRHGALLLDIAEGRITLQVKLVGSFPRIVIRRAP